MSAQLNSPSDRGDVAYLTLSIHMCAARAQPFTKTQWKIPFRCSYTRRGRQLTTNVISPQEHSIPPANNQNNSPPIHPLHRSTTRKTPTAAAAVASTVAAGSRPMKTKKQKINKTRAKSQFSGWKRTSEPQDPKRARLLLYVQSIYIYEREKAVTWCVFAHVRAW